MNPSPTPRRCRIVLITPPGVAADILRERLDAALEGGDVASLIVPQYDLSDEAFQLLAESLVPPAQAAGAAVMLAGDSRVAGRVGADGLHVEGNLQAIGEAIEKHQGHMMIGVGDVKDRDGALALGELRPDYIFFGRFGYDNKPEPHQRNLGLGEWWAEMIEIPCIVLAGSDLASVDAVAATGAEFVALGNAVFGEGVDAREAVRLANQRLDASAPAAN
ncbi:MAG: thiamine phosphate synthase [Rhizobiaceae bacterium]